jgi:hypothetical protein
MVLAVGSRDLVSWQTTKNPGIKKAEFILFVAMVNKATEESRR